MIHATDILCIAGPTASGKSRLALSYAAHQASRGISVELICADSATVYRGMDIGTAKPTSAELAICPHHLIDILDPTESYSAGLFARDAERLIDEIQSRHHEPVLVGGTMLYFKALISGINDLPSANLEIRATIEKQAQSSGWPALHQILMQHDPITAARLNPNDAQRISRALEVLQTTGHPLSSLHSPSRSSLKHYHFIALEPQSRADLHERIAKRFDAMLAQGLIDEVKQLKSHADTHADLPSMRAVGYRQVWQYLDDIYSKEAMRDMAIAATRQLAKRQLTWLRNWAGKQTLASETANLQSLLDLLT